MGKSFNRVGDDLLRILVTLVKEEIKRRESITKSTSSKPSESNTNDNPTFGENNRSLNQPNGDSENVYDVMIRTATKIMGHFARVGKATRPMACYPDFLG